MMENIPIVKIVTMINQFIEKAQPSMEWNRVKDTVTIKGENYSLTFGAGKLLE